MSHSYLYKIGHEGQPIREELIPGKESIIRTLTYFDIFHYPLTCDEIRQFLDRRMPENVFLECLRLLLEEKKLYFFNGVYSIQNNPLLEHRRKQGNRRAEKLLARAMRVGRFLYQFPFVSAIGISGSLSKNYADENSDFDFFIITRANRLWIARTFMHLYKKFTFLTGRQHYFCMNYYVDEKALEIKEQNIFTAIEIKTLLPVSGEMGMNSFFEMNGWAEQQLPACRCRKQSRTDPSASWLKKILEWMFTGKPGDRLDDYLFRLTRSRWNRKEEKGMINMKGNKMGLISGKHFARSNPDNFQDRILAMYAEKLSSSLR